MSTQYLLATVHPRSNLSRKIDTHVLCLTGVPPHWPPLSPYSRIVHTVPTVQTCLHSTYWADTHVHIATTVQTYSHSTYCADSTYWADILYVHTVPTWQTYICPHSSHCMSQVCLYRHTHILCPTDRCFPCTGHPSPPIANIPPSLFSIDLSLVPQRTEPPQCPL